MLGTLLGGDFDTIWKEASVVRLPSDIVAMSRSRFETITFRYPLKSRQSQAERLGNEINILSLPGIEP